MTKKHKEIKVVSVFPSQYEKSNKKINRFINEEIDFLKNLLETETNVIDYKIEERIRDLKKLK